MQTFERENKIYGTYDMMEKIVPSLSELSNHKNRQLWNILNLFKLSSDDAYVLASLATIYKKDCRFTIVDKSAYTLLEIIADKLEIRRELCREKKDLIIQSCFSRSGSFHLVLNGWLKLLATDPVKLKEERNGDFESDPFLSIIDDRISIIKNAIVSKTALHILSPMKFGIIGLEKVRSWLEDNNIPVIIAKKKELTLTAFISYCIEAMKMNGIALFDHLPNVPDRMLSDVTNWMSLRWGTIERNCGEDLKERDEVPLEEAEGMLHLLLRFKFSAKEKTEEKISNLFGKNKDLILPRVLKYGVDDSTVSIFKDIITTTTNSKDEMEKLFSLIKHGLKDTCRTERYYDISVINADMDIDILTKVIDANCSEGRKTTLLFNGPSGTGKTAFAHYLANSLRKNLIVKDAADVMQRYWGESEKVVKEAFSEAEHDGVLLFDEIETYLIKGFDSDNAKEHSTLANCFLQCMDMFSGVMIGTTNYADIIDSAFVRRFSKIIEFKYPEEHQMLRLLNLYFPTIGFNSDEINRLAQMNSIGPGDMNAIKDVLPFITTDKQKDYVITSLIKTAKSRLSKNPKNKIGFH